MKKLCLFLTGLALVASICLGVAACKKKPAEKSSFAVPANVKVEGDTLSWDAVENAEIYTVKINADETTTAKTNSLDLKSVTAKLVSGDNKLSVKVNATEDKDESAYSAEVTYKYSQPVTPPPSTEKTPFSKLTVTLSGNTVSWTAADGATNGYTVKIGESTLTVNDASLDLTSDKATALLVRGDNLISVKVNAAGDRTESEYSNTVTYEYIISADVEAQAFIASVNAIGTVTLESENAITLAKAKYKALSGEAKEVEGVTAAITALTQKDCAYFSLLVAEVATVSGGSTKAELEGAKTAIDGALDYYEKLIDFTGAAEAKSALDGKKTAYENAVAAIQASVDTLADEIDTLLAKEYNSTDKKPVLEDYNALAAKVQAIEALTEYAASYWTENYSAKSTAITMKQAEITTIPVRENSDIFTAASGANGEITVLYSAVNVLEEALTFTTAPTVTIEIDGAGTVTDADVQLTAAGNGIYKYTKAFVKDSEATNGYELKVTYTVGGCGEQTVMYEQFRHDIFFVAENDLCAVNPDNKIVFAGDGVPAGFEAHFDIYLASDITVGSNGILPTVSGYPLIRNVSVKNEMTVEEFRAQLARNYSEILVGNGIDEKVYEVRFVVFRESEGDEGIIYTNINTVQVSHDTFTLDLTEEDKKVKLFIGGGGEGIWGADSPDDGYYILGGRINMEELKTQLFGTTEAITDDQVYAELCYTVSVTLDGVTKEFSVDCEGGGIPSAVLRRNIYNLFKNETDDGYILQVRLALRENSEYSDRLKDSDKIPPLDWTYTVSKTDAQFPTQNLGGQSLNTNVTIDLTEASGGEIVYGGWQFATDNGDPGNHSVFMHEYHDGLALLIFEASASGDENRDFVAEGVEPFAVYNHREWSNIQWADVNQLIDNVWGGLPADMKTNQKYFVFVLQVIMNEAGQEAGYLDSAPVYLLDSEGNHAVVEYNRDFTVPTGIQLRFSGAFFEFLRENQPVAGDEGKGAIFNAKYGVTMIEIEFSNGSQTYSAFLFEEDGKLNMYKDAQKSGNVRDCDTITNGYREVGLFEAWVKEEYGIEGEFSIDGWSFRTKIHHDGTYYVGEGEFSASVTYNA